MIEKIQHITVGYDFSAGGHAAVRAAAELARRASAALHIVTAIPGAIDEAAESPGTDPAGLNLGADALAQVESQVRSTLATALDPSIKVTFEAGFAKPVGLVLEASRNHSSDIIVLGAVGRDSSPDRGIGVDAMKIVRRSTLPVLVVPADVAWPPRRVLCAIDFSEASERALDGAVAISKAMSVPLTALHVIEVANDIDWATFGVPAPTPVSETSAKALRRLNEMLDSRDAGSNARAVCVEGRAADAVAAESINEQVDLLVIGSIGRNPIAEALVGGTTERVLRRMPCAVLATKPDSFSIRQGPGGIDIGSASGIVR